MRKNMCIKVEKKINVCEHKIVETSEYQKITMHENELL